nr:hypothetical protein GCM10025732_04870 [Glycomyces mayteni]
MLGMRSSAWGLPPGVALQSTSFSSWSFSSVMFQIPTLPPEAAASPMAPNWAVSRMRQSERFDHPPVPGLHDLYRLASLKALSLSNTMTLFWTCSVTMILKLAVSAAAIPAPTAPAVANGAPIASARSKLRLFTGTPRG